MKLSIPILLSALTSVAVGRPNVKVQEGDTLAEVSQMTALAVDENGNPSVECWEFTNLFSNMKVSRKDGSVGTAQSMNIAGSDELDGVDVITWPSYTPIWPPPDASSLDDEVKADWLSLSGSFNLFTVQSGMISAKFSAFAAETEDEIPELVFDMQNGDDWFYFEDVYTGSSRQLRADSAVSPIQLSTISGVETEAIRMLFPRRPPYKVLHKGPCSFTGITTPAESKVGKSTRVNSRLRKQQYGKTGL